MSTLYRTCLGIIVAFLALMGLASRTARAANYPFNVEILEVSSPVINPNPVACGHNAVATLQMRPQDTEDFSYQWELFLAENDTVDEDSIQYLWSTPTSGLVWTGSTWAPWGDLPFEAPTETLSSPTADITNVTLKCLNPGDWSFQIHAHIQFNMTMMRTDDPYDTYTGDSDPDEYLNLTVFTGLRITGDFAGTLKSQIEAAAKCTLAMNSNGEVSITALDSSPAAWQVTFRTYLDAILSNSTQTVEGTINLWNVPVGDYLNQRCDPPDIAAVATADAREGAAILAHELYEQFLIQVYYQDFDTEAHPVAISVECAITGATSRSASPLTINAHVIRFTMVYNVTGGGHITLIFDVDDRQATIQNVNVTR